MLTDIFYIVVGSIIQAIAAVFSLLNFIFPTETVTHAFITIFSYINYLGGIIDVPTMMTVLILLATFESVWYGYKIVLFIIKVTPWIGNPNHPTT